MADDLDKDTISEDDDEEELDPRIQLELEKLNAATDGINHLETEFGETQALFQQMMQDATFQLKRLNQQIGKSVDKSRPYYEALKKAKQRHATLHDAAVKFEQAQSRHYNAKKRVMDAEKRASSSSSRKLDPALQEMLNQVTIEVMEASSASQVAWEIHRAASIDFEEKQKAVQVIYKTLQKHIIKSRSYFDMKFALNRQLEVQKQRLEKIQEGIQLSKNAYAETLNNLEAISVDIHRAREEKRRSMFLEPHSQDVGLDSDLEGTVVHSETMQNIRNMTLDNVKLHNTEDSDCESSDSEISNCDDTLLKSDTHFDVSNVNHNSGGTSADAHQDKPGTNIPFIFRSNSNSSLSALSTSTGGDKSGGESIVNSMEEPTESNIKEIYEKVDDSYDVITSSSIPMSPPPIEILPEFDITDSGKNIIKELRARKRARSYTDLTKVCMASQLIDISKSIADSDSKIITGHRRRSDTGPRTFVRPRKWNSFSAGINDSNNNNSGHSPPSTPENMKKAISRVAALTLTPAKDVDDEVD